MRGQATSIQHSHQRNQGSNNKNASGQAFLPTSSPSTKPGRLSHLKVSQGLGSDASSQRLKTPGSFQTYLLFTMQTEQASIMRTMQTFISSKDNAPISVNTNRFGGAYRDRTDDPLLAKQVLSQLS
jgi:hypothetical protein